MEDHLQGFLGAIIAIIGFGTYAVPTKIVDTGDGVVFQWFQCAAILIMGFVVQFFTYSLRFEPFAMLGGAIWCIGNSMVVPIVSRIGIGLGMLIWGVCNMIFGWSAGSFGIIVSKEVISNPILNYVGVALAILSSLMYLFIKPEIKRPAPSKRDEFAPLNYGVGDEEDDFKPTTSKSENPTTQKIIAIILSIISGLFYGFNTLPVTYLIEHNPGSGPLDFAFSHFSGIFLCSTAILVIYCISKKNRPVFNRESLMSGLVAGVLWGTAQCGWFVGNANLGLAVAFPLICIGPGLVASIIGVVIFKEVTGKRNFIFLIAAFMLTVAGVLCIAYSNT